MEMTDNLRENLSAFSNAVNITLSIIDLNGDIAETFGPECNYCKQFQTATGKYCPCTQTHFHACKQAADLGEGYIFLCPAGMIHFAVPIFRGKTHIGSVLAGPISLEYTDISLIDDVLQKFDISLEYRDKMYAARNAVPLVEPFRARYLSKLLFLLVTNLMANDQAELQKLSEKTIQQAKIGEYIQLIKENNNVSFSQRELEKSLLSDVLSGNAEGVKAILNEMLGRIYFTSGNNIQIIKTRAIELLAFLSRAVVENKGDEKTIYQMTDNFLHAITTTNNLTDLSFVLLEALEKMTNLAFSSSNTAHLSVIKKSIEYMNDHYNSNPTLEDVAGHVALNPTYFSTLFKKETGVNFSSYMTNLKIEHAKRLLKETNLPLITIATELGFDSQSYFSNVFKKYMHMTPKHYRECV